MALAVQRRERIGTSFFDDDEIPTSRSLLQDAIVRGRA